MPSDRVKPFIDTAWKMIGMTLEEKGSVTMCAILISMEKGDLTFVPPMGAVNKETYAIIIAEAAKATKCDLVVMISEAWILRKKISDEEFAELDKTGLSNHPDRAEILQVRWKTAYGEKGQEVRYLMRDKEKPYVGEALDMGPGVDFVDRFFDRIFEGKHKPH